MPALQASTPRREAARAAVLALAAFLGGALWVLAEATGPSPVGALAAFSTPAAAIAPKAWALDPATWTGWAALPHALRNLTWPLRLLSLAFIATAALGVIHPGALRRPAPYYLPPLRKTIAYVSALLIGAGIPAAALRLAAALTPEVAAGNVVDAAVLVRLAFGVTLFCAFLWTLAGPGVLNVRAALRFSHGALAGLSIWAALALAVLLTTPLTDLAELSSAGNALVAVDAGHGAPGHTYGWVLSHSMLVYGVGLGLAGALAVASAPQSLGRSPRLGSTGVAAAVLLLLMGTGWLTARGVHRVVAEAAPDVSGELGLGPLAAARPVILLAGDAFARRRVSARVAMQPVTLAQDCSPAPAWAERTLPAATAGNAARLERALAGAGAAVSGRTARDLGCLIAIRALLFQPEEARRLIFEDPSPARVGFFAFWTGVRGLIEHPATGASRRWLESLSDTARYAVMAEGRARLERLGKRVAADTGVEVRGRLVAPSPEEWRVGLVRGADPATGADPWLFAPRTDGQILQYMIAAATPAADGTFSFGGLAPGWYQLALLAPGGILPERLAGLSIRGDPGQFAVSAAGRRGLGTITLSF